MKVYLVGGAVRDAQLGYPYHENDWVVVGATQAQMLEKGFQQVGNDFPVFLHPDSKEEYALARTEKKVGKGYQGFVFSDNAEVTLEQDLSRRDLTINAIAQDKHGKLIDPYGGLDDLNQRIIRHVSPAFIEDPVRLLRVARFCARYHHLGFSIAPDTLSLMQNMVNNGEIHALVAERCWQETEKALGEKNPEMFFSTLHECDALDILFPGFGKLFQQKDAASTLAHLKRSSAFSEKASLRFSALMLDLHTAHANEQKNTDKHALISQTQTVLDTLTKQLKIPNEFSELARTAIAHQYDFAEGLELPAEKVVDFFAQTDAFRRPDRFMDLLGCYQSMASGKSKQIDTRASSFYFALNICKAIKASQFMQQGVNGKKLGEAIHAERVRQVQQLKDDTQASLKLKTTTN